MLELNKVYHGDCLDVMKDIDDGSIDAIITDPPYGTTACKWDSIIPLEPMWKELKRVIKRNGAIVLFGSQPFTSALIMSNIGMFKYCWVWDKITAKGHLVAKIRPMQQTEDIIIFGIRKIFYTPIMIDRPKEKIQYRKLRECKRTEIMGGKQGKLEPKIYDKWYPKTLLSFANGRPQDLLHPTQKPVALVEYLIKTYTNEADLVLDFAAGSGTTGVACKHTQRNFILIEKEAEYVDIAKQRIENPDYVKPTKNNKTKNIQQGFFTDEELKELTKIKI